MMKPVFAVLLFMVSISAFAERNLILITIDGLRWQEVFKGPQENLLTHPDYVKYPVPTKEHFWHKTAEQRREFLMPFMWQVVAQQGAMIGDRDKGSKMSVANPWYFSYPGYSEILTGVADERINTNQKIPNPHISFMEYLQGKGKIGQHIALFAGWDVFPYILNTDRSGVYVNAGYQQAEFSESEHIKLLNQLQQETPKIWHNVRLDTFTYRMAKAWLLEMQPNVLAIAFGETDDFAHDGHYDQYLFSAQRTDVFIADLWQTLQSHPKYKDNTNVIITTDHGRGATPEQWRHHASRRATKGYLQSLAHFKNGIEGAEHIWLAAIGPDIAPQGLITTSDEIKQKQIAATALELLGYSKAEFNPDAAPAIKELIKP